jgi:hypothetical protein
MQAQPALQDIFFVSHEAIPARFMPSVMTTNPASFHGHRGNPQLVRNCRWPPSSVGSDGKKIRAMKTGNSKQPHHRLVLLKNATSTVRRTKWRGFSQQMKTKIALVSTTLLSATLLVAAVYPHQTYTVKIKFSNLTFEELQNIPSDAELQQDILNGWAADPNSANFTSAPTVQVSGVASNAPEASLSLGTSFGSDIYVPNSASTIYPPPPPPTAAQIQAAIQSGLQAEAGIDNATVSVWQK